MKKITARISALIILFSLLPSVMGLWTLTPKLFGKPMQENLSDHSTRYNPYLEENLTFELNTGVERALIRLDETEQKVKQEELKAQQFVRSTYVFLLLISLLAFIYTIYIWVATKIVLDGDMLKIYTPGYFFLVNKSFINISDISQILIQTTTPLIPVKTSIDQINWRDKIHISNNTLKKSIISLFIYPKAKSIILKLIAQNPNISVVFRKDSIMENLGNSLK